MGDKKRNKTLVLSNTDLFIIYSRKYFDSFFRNLNYDVMIYDKGSYIVFIYSSKELKQEIKICYDFFRSNIPYFQIELTVHVKWNKIVRIEVLDYLDRKINPKSFETIEEVLSLIKEFFVRYFIVFIKGEMKINEFVSKYRINTSNSLCQYESNYLNNSFKYYRKDFDFTDKKIGFIIGDKKSNKKKYFEGKSFFIKRNKSTLNYKSLYIFDEQQKEESGGYDAVICSWCKRTYSMEEIIEKLKKK
jgi:hypothetical protein